MKEEIESAELEGVSRRLSEEKEAEKGFLRGECVKLDELPKPFSAFGSYRQRHGDMEEQSSRAAEAPAKLGMKPDPVIIPPAPGSPSIFQPRKKPPRPKHKTQSELEAAWERKRELLDRNEAEHRAIVRCKSDMADRPTRTVPRSRYSLSLTEEDMDELRGSLDLGFGFGFSNQGDRELWNTLPALELCHQLQQVKLSGRSSPVSSHDGEDSPLSISSPGDEPQIVKSNIKRWAQAVACTVKNSL